MQTARFFLDAAADGRVQLLAPRGTTLADTGDYSPEGPRRGEFRWQMGTAAMDEPAYLSFRIGDRLFHVAVTSEIAPVEAEKAEPVMHIQV